ncbi:hypothetical protein EYF80_064532 [Liparis tanakae]|uniref:Uncharacterized protein n=1 Tax=Liparis tanakae TaxID=230148 RepID=A0A4Z2E9B9_9TELE|nr:hypothetical protein EYF80_064532 [Liparis tanakae]
MSSFILSSEVVHDSPPAVSGITFMGMDRGRDSGGDRKPEGFNGSNKTPPEAPEAQLHPSGTPSTSKQTLE